MKQKLLNKLWLRVGMIVAIMTTALAGTAKATDYTELFSIAAGSVVSGSTYKAHTAIDGEGRNYVITFGGNNKSVGTNSGNRGNCNLSSYSKYAVSPVTTSSTASAFACTTSLTDIAKISYTFIGGSNQTSTKVYLLYSSDNTTFSQVSLTSGTQGATISDGTAYTFVPKTGYFALLFEATNASGNWRIDDVYIHFYGEVTPAYTITPVSNNDSYGTVSVTGTTITATPNDGYRVVAGDGGYTVTSGTATVINNGNNTFSVTPSTDCTIQINFEALPTYTVTFSDGGSVTQASYGASVTLPSRGAISSYTFAGWSETEVEDETTTAPTIIPAGSYTPTADITLYPVYSKTEGGGAPAPVTVTKSVSELASANSWSDQLKYVSVSLDANITAEASSGANTGKYYSNDNSWRFYSSESATLTITSSSGDMSSITLTYSQGAFSYEDEGITNGSPVTVSGKSAVFECTTKAFVNSISVTYNGASAGTTYYWSSPVVATVERPEITPDDNPFTFSTNVEITCETDDATIYYTLDGTDPTDASTEYEDPFEITSACTIKAIAIKGSDESSIASLYVTKSLAPNTITVTGGTSQTIDLGQSEYELELTATATNGETVTFTIDDVNTTLTEDDDFLFENNTIEIYSDNLGVIVLKANAAGNADYAAATEVTITITVDNSMLPGRVGNPYTVAQARDAIDAAEGTTNVYATGIVSQAGTVNGSGQISYYISADGLTTSDQLQAYRGKGIGGADFESNDDIQVGDVVVIYGNLKKYNSIYEFDQNNQLVSLVRKTDSDLAITSNATVNLTITSAEMNPTSTITYETSSTGDIIFVSGNDGVATVSDAGVITAQGEGSTTITVMQEADADYKAGEQTITVTVTDNRSAVATGIDLPAAQKTLTVGDMDNFAPTATIDAGFTGSVTYTYATSDASVVEVDEDTFSAEAAGTATITITATPTGGNAANYKTATQEVEVTVKGATTLTLSGSTATPTYPATAAITATVAEGYDGTLTVSTNNAAVATASIEGTTITITPVAVGTATITVTAPETSLFNGEVERTIAVTVNAPIGGTTAPAAEGTETFDFSTNGWGLPTTSSSTLSGDYTNGSQTVTISGTGYYYGSKALLLGKNGATITLPAFAKPVYQIDVVGVDGASGSVKQNIYVDSYAVSTETTGANGVTNEYEIDSEYRAAGTIYTLKVTSNHNTQIARIVVHMYQEPTISVTLNASGYATFCSEYPVTFSGSEDFSAWRIESINSSNEITFARVTGSVIGGTGLLLKGEAGASIEITSADYDDTPLGTNLLEGTLAPKYVTAGQYYGLSGENFVKVNAGTVKKGKALLPASNVTEAGVKAFTFVFEDDATAIKDLNDLKDSKDLNDVIYNLAGQRMNKMQKGINIVNGKKIMVK